MERGLEGALLPDEVGVLELLPDLGGGGQELLVEQVQEAGLARAARRGSRRTSRGSPCPSCSPSSRPPFPEGWPGRPVGWRGLYARSRDPVGRAGDTGRRSRESGPLADRLGAPCAHDRPSSAARVRVPAGRLPVHAPKTVVYDLADADPGGRAVVRGRGAALRDTVGRAPPGARLPPGGPDRRRAVPVVRRARRRSSLHFEERLAPRRRSWTWPPTRGWRTQSVEVQLNGVPVADLRLADVRSRYPLLAPGGRAATGREPPALRLRGGGVARPSADPASRDRRELAARVLQPHRGPRGRARLQDLLRREAPRPFEVDADRGRPSLEPRRPRRGPLRAPPAGGPPSCASRRSCPWPRGRRRGPRRSASRSSRRTTPGRSGSSTASCCGATRRAPVRWWCPCRGRTGQHRSAWASSSARWTASRFAWGTWRAPRVLGRDGQRPARRRRPCPRPWTRAPTPCGRG